MPLYMRGRDGTDTSYMTDTILIGAGESYDVIIEAPTFSGGTAIDEQGRSYDKYILYNRRYTQDSNLTAGGGAGQRTEVRVYPAGTLARPAVHKPAPRRHNWSSGE